METKTDEAEKKPTLKRRVITIEEKIKILDLLKSGEKQGIVAKIWNLNESTIRTIKQNEQKIRRSLGISGAMPSTKRVARVRDTLMEKMEKSLVKWIQECNEKKVELSGNLIKVKALYIYENLKQSEPPSEENSQHEFRASKGWFERFRKRHCLHNNKLQEECISTEPIRKFPQDLLEIIKEGGYSIEEFAGMSENEIRELIDEEINLNEENLVQLIENDKSNTNFDDSSCTEDSDYAEPVKEFNVKKLTEGLNLAQQLKSYFMDNDPSAERSEKFIKQLDNCLAPYHELKQNLFTNFLTKKPTQLSSENKNNKINTEQISNNNNIKSNTGDIYFEK
ncbi:tigger transposable element-derived protein 1-like [Chrysoperla carnea]|uniref:tigger transposable element-derived protein 1-like n=1 Tax=Chrysoperla carnea TaxID=189513 RepID=UPI001D05C307|nr:tigger transposable element-derived protein 1-like [Chrysoperla carnea]